VDAAKATSLGANEGKISNKAKVLNRLGENSVKNNPERIQEKQTPIQLHATLASFPHKPKPSPQALFKKGTGIQNGR
jgi:hypothetical protein